MDELGHFGARCPDKGVLINGKVSPGQAVEKDFILLDLNGNQSFKRHFYINRLFKPDCKNSTTS